MKHVQGDERSDHLAADLMVSHASDCSGPKIYKLACTGDKNRDNQASVEKTVEFVWRLKFN